LVVNVSQIRANVQLGWENRIHEQGADMKITLNIVGGVLVLFGAIWFLQGINVLPGSFMTGQIRIPGNNAGIKSSTNTLLYLKRASPVRKALIANC
jgi:hypothetical protein